MMEEQIAAAAEILRKGGVILYPTDTVWGLGCDATNGHAVEKVLKIKRSAARNGLIVLMGSPDMAVRYVNGAPQVAWELMEVADKPLTLILPGGVGVAPELLADDGSIAVRVPDHEFCRRLLHRFRRPLVSTSANVSGMAAPRDFADIAPEITAAADLVVDPSLEGHPTGKPSSIIRLGRTGEVTIIR
jgi:L-threonylcarbamoyladenylate synthase